MVQVYKTEAVRKTPTAYPEEKFLISLVPDKKGKKKKEKRRDRFHLRLVSVVFH